MKKYQFADFILWGVSRIKGWDGKLWEQYFINLQTIEWLESPFLEDLSRNKSDILAPVNSLVGLCHEHSMVSLFFYCGCVPHVVQWKKRRRCRIPISNSKTIIWRTTNKSGWETSALLNRTFYHENSTVTRPLTIPRATINPLFGVVLDIIIRVIKSIRMNIFRALLPIRSIVSLCFLLACNLSESIKVMMGNWANGKSWIIISFIVGPIDSLKR